MNVMHHLNSSMDYFTKKTNSRRLNNKMSVKHHFNLDKIIDSKAEKKPPYTRQTSTDAVLCRTIRCPLRCMWVNGRFMGKGRNQSCSQPMLWTT